MDTPLILCTIPKSGTYLVSAILEYMGLWSTGIHLALGDEHRNYKKAPSVEDARNEHPWCAFIAPIGDTIAALEPGQFLATHQGPLVRVFIHKPIPIVFLYRDLRNCLVSHARWLKKTGRWKTKDRYWRKLDGPPAISAALQERGWPFSRIVWEAASWLTVPHSLTICFERLVGEKGSDAQQDEYVKVANFVGWKGDMIEAIKATVGKDTLTWSGQLSRWEDLWSDGAQLVYEGTGLKLINRYMGYE